MRCDVHRDGEQCMKPAHPWMVCDGRHVFASDFRVLIANIAIAGALTRVFRLGEAWGFWASRPYDGAEMPWHQNTEGDAAP